MNKDTKHNEKVQLIRFLLNETTAEENISITERLNHDHEYKKKYNDFKTVWDNSKHHISESTIDTDVAWKKFTQRIEQKGTKDKKTIKLSNNRNSFFKIAATILLLIFCSITGYTIYQQPVTIVAENEVIIETLPDGSLVTLNKFASITYPRNFKGETRELKLIGEAFFDVTPNKEKPFVITANDATVKVIGTSFNIKCSKAITEVVVETGIVSVSKEKGAIMLTPNEKAIVRKNKTLPFKEVNKDKLYNYYRTKEFICEETPLWRLVDVLNEAYETEIIIANNDIKNLSLNTTFHNESLDYVLSIISETFNIHVIDQNGRKILR